MSTTRAAVLREKAAEFVFEDVTVGEPRAGEVLVRLVASGVCHTDLLVRDQILPPGLPAILGHEGSGVVAEVGAGVTGLAPGDPVVLAPLSCGRCRNCLGGHPMHCDAWGPLNLRGRRADGSTAYLDAQGAELNAHFFGQSSFAGHVVVREQSVVKVPDTVPLELLGPLGCGIQAGAGTVLRVLAPEPGSTIAVLGAGTVGLAAVMAARVAGCARIIVTDLHEARRELALELGATDVLTPGPDTVSQVLALTGRGAGYVVDAVGLPQTARTALAVLAMGGTAAIAGSAGSGQEVALDLTQLMGRRVCGVIEGDSVPRLLIPQLIELFRAGRFPFDRLVRTYPFEDLNQAVADSEAGRAVKPVVLYPAP